MVFERVVLSAGFIALVVGGLTVLSGFSELSWWMSVPIIVGGGVAAAFAILGFWSSSTEHRGGKTNDRAGCWCRVEAGEWFSSSQGCHVPVRLCMGYVVDLGELVQSTHGDRVQ